MALIGWIDDRIRLGIVIRLVCQSAVAVGVGYYLISMSFDSQGFEIRFLVWLFCIVLGIIWVTNLYNFMDGMDGLAASQAVIVLVTLSIWFNIVDAGSVSLFCLILAAATAGFGVVNWHPARVFMGDAGSLSLGITIAVVSIGGVLLYELPALAFFLLMGVFLFDATVTLSRRFCRKERWWESHRSHFYQRAQAVGFSQVRIVSTIIVMDLILAILSSSLIFSSTRTGWVVGMASIVLLGPVYLVRRYEARHAQGNPN